MIKWLWLQKLISSLVNRLFFNFSLFGGLLSSHIFWSWPLLYRHFNFVLLGNWIGHFLNLNHGIPRVIMSISSELNKFAAIAIQFSQIDVRFLLRVHFLLFLNCNFVRFYDFVSIHCHEIWIPSILFLRFQQLSFILVNFDKFTPLNDGVSISCDIFVTMV